MFRKTNSTWVWTFLTCLTTLMVRNLLAHFYLWWNVFLLSFKMVFFLVSFSSKKIVRHTCFCCCSYYINCLQVHLYLFNLGDVKLSQSVTIMRYLAEKHNMLGKTIEERWRIDLLAEQSSDMRNMYHGFFYQLNNIPYVSK